MAVNQNTELVTITPQIALWQRALIDRFPQQRLNNWGVNATLSRVNTTRAD
jgi:hypothetical protein